MKRESLYIPSLDGLRAFAIGVVFVAHAGLSTLIPGHFGVTVFFFLSGFLITTLLRMEFERSGSVSLKDFYLRRVLRIFPPFYLVLILATALTAFGFLAGPRLTPGGLLSQAFFLTNYYVISSGWWVGHAPGTWIYWSLAVEEHFYLAFPLLYLALLRWLPSPRRKQAVLLGLCALVLVWRCVLVFHFHSSKERTYIATDARIDSILFGCALAVLGNPVLDRTRFSAATWKWVLLPLGMMGLGISLAFRNPNFQQSIAYTLQGIALIPIFVAAMRYHDWFLFRPLNWGWFKFLGVLSYSLYLLHPTVLFGVNLYVHGPAVVRGALGGLISLLIAVAIYYAIERPAARLRRRLSRIASSRQAAPTPVPAAAVVAAKP